MDPRFRLHAERLGPPEGVLSARAGCRGSLGAGEGHVRLTDEAGLVMAFAVLMGRHERRAALPGLRIETVPDSEWGERSADSKAMT